MFNKQLDNVYFSLITALFLLVNGLWFWKMGIMADADTKHYFQYAKEIDEQELFYKPHYFLYLGYVLFILLLGKISQDPLILVLAQYVLSYLSVWALYQSSLMLFDSKKTALLTVALFLGFVFISFWNLFLYAESLLISLICFSFYFLLRWNRGDLGKVGKVLALTIWIWALMTKPTGLSVLLAVSVFFSVKLWNSLKSTTIKYFLAGLILSAFLIVLNSMLHTFGFESDFTKGEILYNARAFQDADYAKYMLVQVPENLWLAPSVWPPLLRLISLYVMNPFYAFQLVFLKVFYFLLDIRPYYSLAHNLALLAFLPLVYFFFIKELLYGKVSVTLKITLLAFLAVHIFSNAFLTINWNTRFLVPMLPIVFLFASNQVSVFVERLKNRKRFSFGINKAI